MCRSARISRRLPTWFHHRSEVGGQNLIIQPRRVLQCLLQVGDVDGRKDNFGIVVWGAGARGCPID